MACTELNAKDVPLGIGPPTFEELALHYPAKFTWFQLKLFINSGDLGLLKRDKSLQVRYMKWAEGIRAEYGSVANYLTTYRLQWGKSDRLSLLPSKLEDASTEFPMNCEERDTPRINEKDTTPSVPWFTVDTPANLISIIQNDWPYSVPLDIEHSLVWTQLPILPPPFLMATEIAESLSPELRTRVTSRLNQDGLWGFTGSLESPPSSSLLPQYLGALSEWDVTMEKLIISPKGTPAEECAVMLAGQDVQRFVTRRWIECEWETAWFVNPPRLQSVKGLAHIHIFARKKNEKEMAEWKALL